MKGRGWVSSGWRLVMAVIAAALIAAGCGNGSSGAPSAAPNTVSERPYTPATLEILAPGPNARTAQTVDVDLRLDHAHLTGGTQVGGVLRPDRGHIHLSVDGKLVAMPSRLHDRLPRLPPGTHTLQAEFVASDHLPFSNRVVAAVTFRVA